ncbi:DinB family protein [Tenacibaculum amylolyticum]|uniref:DinB family protein n=1 Tax=Tenacibaculum amylolyticum TaxID=104269 RepID=UPI0038946DAF
MVFKTNELIQELQDYVQSHIAYVTFLQSKSKEDLQSKRDDKTWSAIECIEHLNRYATFYNQEIRKRLSTSTTTKISVFKSGYWGNKFALDMLPKERMKKMKTFKSKNPIYSRLNTDKVVQDFLELQEELLELLESAKEKDLTNIKTAITLPILKFRLGDTFRFVIYHNERHIVQAKRALKGIKKV